MQVVLSDGTTLYIDFTVHYHKRGSNNVTNCQISKLNFVAGCLVAAGTAKCNSVDRYDKAIGKAKALARALEELYPGSSHRGMRLEIWRAFQKHLAGCPDLAHISQRRLT